MLDPPPCCCDPKVKADLRFTCTASSSSRESKAQIKRGRDTKYNSQNKSPVYCQTTNFAHTSKQAVIKQKVADKNKTKRKKQKKGKRKEALFFGLTLPYKQTSYGTAKVHTLNLLECSEFNGLRGCLSCFYFIFFFTFLHVFLGSVEIS